MRTRATLALLPAVLLLLPVASAAQEHAVAASSARSPDAHHEVRISTPDAAVVLAGTLSLPAAAAPQSVVLFLTGSGDHPRDQVISGTPMFARIAEPLLAAGHATLRLDDRGTAQSTGPTTTASTTADRVLDMQAAVAWLGQDESTRGVPIVLLGHSEGAMVAAGVAAREPTVAGVILLGAPARAGSVVWIEQQMAGSAEHLGQPVDSLAAVRSALEAVVARSVGGEDEAAIEAAGIALFEAVGMGEAEVRSSGLLAEFTARVASPWFRHFLAYDPGEDYARVRAPTLAVYGSIDRLTAPAVNRPALEAALGRGGSDDVTVLTLEDQDHFFLRSPELPPGRHRFGSMHVAPELLAALVEWLDLRFRVQDGR